MNDLKIFQNEEFGEIRTLTIDGEPWFVAKDITDRLKYSNGRKAVADHVDDEDKGVTKVTTLGGNQDMTIINERGVYSLVFGSNMPEAKRFKRWVTFEVLPEIRKTGSYKLPQTYQEALRALADKQDELEKMLPKAEFYDAVIDSNQAISIGDAAKVLNMGIGQNNLFRFLRQQGILMSDNKPYQKYIDAGYFRVIEQSYLAKGETRLSFKTMVYQKGLDFIRKKIRKEEGEL